MNENAGREVNERDPAIGGLVAHRDYKDRLKKVNWTKKNKRPVDKLGEWKANEYIK